MRNRRFWEEHNKKQEFEYYNEQHDISLKIKYNIQPEEQRTMDYPGCPAHPCDLMAFCEDGSDADLPPDVWADIEHEAFRHMANLESEY